MRVRSVKSRIFVLLMPPLVALVALWVFAAATTLSDNLRQSRARTFTERVARPTDDVIAALQNERRMSLSNLGDDATIGRAGFDAQRTETDRALAAFRKATGSGAVRGATGNATRRRIVELSEALNRLRALREAVDRRTVDRAQAMDRYTAFIDLAADIYDDVPSDDRRAVRDTRLLIALSRARETLAQEDALVTGALAANRLTPAEHLRLVQLAGARRFLYDDASRALTGPHVARYQRIVGGPEFGRFQSLEDRLSRPRGRGGRPPVDIGAWRTSVEAVDWQLDGLSSSVRAAAADRARAAAFTGLLRLGLAGGVGLLAVLAAITVAVRVGRRLIRESRSMSDTVTVFARDLLPTLADAANVRRNGRNGNGGDSGGNGSGADGGHDSVEPGDADDPEAGDSGGERDEGDEGGASEAGAADPGAFTIAEIARIAEAFEEARQAVVRAAEGEAAAHKRLNDVIVTLARRNQSLLQRLLARLETLQRRADRPEELETLFELDHLATRMRRHAEGLVVLSGRPAGRTWRNPVRLVDVARAAAAEVEDYTRVEVEPMGRAALVGPVVADTVHLLAELIENGVAFSPPPTMVRVRGERVGRGFAIEIEDRGLGLSAEELARCNELLATDPEPELGDTARLGLFVVARLAARHAIGVTLRPSPFGGITAIVLVPLDLVVAPPGPRPPALRLGESPTELAAPDQPVPAPERSVPPMPLAAPVPEDEEARAPVRWNVPDEPVIRAARAVEAVRGAQAARAEAEEDEPLPALPVRRRGEHMAPELRGTPEWAAGQGTERRSPEDARRLLTTMQEGLQKGRATEAAGAERPGAGDSWLVRTPKHAKLAEDAESVERAEDAVSEERGEGDGGVGDGGVGESGSAVGEDEGRSGGVGGGGE